MKFLIALSILASSTAFAQHDRYDKIKCYESAQQNGDREVALVLKVMKYDYKKWLEVVYPRELSGKLVLNEQSECLEQERSYPETSFTGRRLKLCETDGQRINGLIPIEAEYGDDEETYYCEKEMKRFFEVDHSPTL